MKYYNFKVLQRIVPPQKEGEPPLELNIGSEYAGGIIRSGDAEKGYLVEKSKTVEAETPRRAWMLTGFADDLKRTSVMTLADRNTFLYDEAKNTIGLTYVDNPESVSGARYFHLIIIEKFAGFVYNTQTVAVYFLLKSADGVLRSYQRPPKIEVSPEDFYDATQWKSALDLFKNTTPMLEKITTIIWAAAGLMSLMVLFMLIFAKGV